jgi:hypothetical protein
MYFISFRKLVWSQVILFDLIQSPRNLGLTWDQTNFFASKSLASVVALYPHHYRTGSDLLQNRDEINFILDSSNNYSRMLN